MDLEQVCFHMIVIIVLGEILRLLASLNDDIVLFCRPTL